MPNPQKSLKLFYSIRTVLARDQKSAIKAVQDGNFAEAEALCDRVIPADSLAMMKLQSLNPDKYEYSSLPVLSDNYAQYVINFYNYQKQRKGKKSDNPLDSEQPKSFKDWRLTEI